jgi:hypothetical protein
MPHGCHHGSPAGCATAGTSATARRPARLTQLFVRRWPAWLLRQTFQGTAHYTARQLAEHMDHGLNSPDAVAFLRALIGTMNPYRPRIPDNGMALFGDLDSLPLHHIRCPTLVVTAPTTPTSSSATVSERTKRFWAPNGSGSRTAHTWDSGSALARHKPRTPHGNSSTEPGTTRQGEHHRDHYAASRGRPRYRVHTSMCLTGAITARAGRADRGR